jgi:HD-like signal output (HDOD) protein
MCYDLLRSAMQDLSQRTFLYCLSIAISYAVGLFHQMGLVLVADLFGHWLPAAAAALLLRQWRLRHWCCSDKRQDCR